MLYRFLLCLGLLLTGTSCVPPVTDAQAGTRGLGTERPSPQKGGRSVIIPPPEVIAAAIAPGHPAQPFTLDEQSEDSRDRSLRCLTEAVYYEARSESEDGQRAVAQVVLNRVRHPAFPNNICGVVYQGSQRRTGCQFSFTCDGSLGQRVEPGAWGWARRIAEEALGGYVHEAVGLATHYHTTAIRPWWAASLTRAVTVGAHVFYRWRGEWGNPKAFRQPYSGEEQGQYAAIDNFGETEAQTFAFGVRIHRGSTEPVARSASNVTVHRSGTSHGVRIRVGVPDNGESDEATMAANEDPETSAPIL